jgi:hypothetical protein
MYPVPLPTILNLYGKYQLSYWYFHTGTGMHVSEFESGSEIVPVPVYFESKTLEINQAKLKQRKSKEDKTNLPHFSRKQWISSTC